MARLNPYAALANPDSDIVQAALKRKCEVCKAKPGAECTNPLLNGGRKPLPGLDGRVVHYARTLQ